MSLPNVIGSINNGSSFVIVNRINGQPAYLNFGVTTSGVKYYYFGGDLQTCISNPNFPTFTMLKSGNGVAFKDQINGGFVAASSSYPYSINGQLSSFTISSCRP